MYYCAGAGCTEGDCDGVMCGYLLFLLALLGIGLMQRVRLTVLCN